MSDAPSSTSADAPARDIGFERLMLARRASAAESRNRPVWMPALAIVALLITLIYTLVGMSALGNAKVVRDAQLFKAQQLQSLVGARRQLQTQLDELESGDGRTGDPRGGGPVGIIQSAAEEAGLGSVSIPRERSERVGGQSNLIRKSYPYANIRANDPGELLEWVVLVLERSPTMDIDSIRLTNTEISGWTMDITFTRVEEAP